MSGRPQLVLQRSFSYPLDLSRLRTVHRLRNLIVVVSVVVVVACSDSTAPSAVVRSIRVDPQQSFVIVDSTVQFSAQVLGDAGAIEDLPISWSSTDTSIATVDDRGLARGIASGRVRIVAQVQDKGSSGSLVVLPRVTSISVAPQSLGLVPGGRLELLVELRDDSDNLIPRVPFWERLDANVATIDEAGVVLAGTEGSTRVIARREGAADTIIVEVATVTFTSITAGIEHACGTTVSGPPYCWSAFAGPALGLEAEVGSLDPTRVRTDLHFLAVSARFGVTCGLTTERRALCWGINDSGQLGNGSTENKWAPDSVQGNIDFTAISVGWSHACGIASDGRAYCWGHNTNGELGDGTQVRRLDPVLVAGALTFQAITAGASHTCGISDSGTTYCWGDSLDGQLGRIGTGSVLEPQPVELPNGVQLMKISAGFGFTCGISSDDAAYCWGRNTSGMLGRGFTSSAEAQPAPISGELRLKDVRAGWNHACGVTVIEVGVCWGSNQGGELGDGTHETRTVPTPVSGDLAFASIHAGEELSCGLTVDQLAYCWGQGLESAIPVLMLGQRR